MVMFDQDDNLELFKRLFLISATAVLLLFVFGLLLFPETSPFIAQKSVPTAGSLFINESLRVQKKPAEAQKSITIKEVYYDACNRTMTAVIVLRSDAEEEVVLEVEKERVSFMAHPGETKVVFNAYLSRDGFLLVKTAKDAVFRDVKWFSLSSC